MKIRLEGYIFCCQLNNRVDTLSDVFHSFSFFIVISRVHQDSSPDHWPLHTYHYVFAITLALCPSTPHQYRYIYIILLTPYIPLYPCITYWTRTIN